MKSVLICIFAVCFLFGFCLTLPANDEGKKKSNKSVAASIADDAKEVKKEFGKTVEATKEAIVRDAKAMKEEIPKSLKETKDSAIQQSKEIKKGATKEFKDIRDNMANPAPKPKTDEK